MNPTVKAALKNTISTLENKSQQTVEADFNVRAASARAQEAQGKISNKETKLNAQQRSLDDINTQIGNPPMKETSSGGKQGGSKKVVDEDELRKLKSQQQNISALVATAKNEVESARADAETATNEALAAAGVKQTIITQASELQTRLSGMQQTVNSGGKVSDESLEKLAEDINTFSGSITKEENKGDILGNAIYDPIARDLKNLIASIERKNTPLDPNAPPPEGSVNRQLFDIGIKGEPQTNIINLMERAADRNLKIDQGQTFTKDQMRAMYTEYKTLTNGLTDTQKNSDVIKGFKGDMEALVTKSGHGDILTESGS